MCGPDAPLSIAPVRDAYRAMETVWSYIKLHRRTILGSEALECGGLPPLLGRGKVWRGGMTRPTPSPPTPKRRQGAALQSPAAPPCKGIADALRGTLNTARGASQ